MAAVIAGAEVIGQLGAEQGRDGSILSEGAVLAVCVVLGQRLGGDVLGDPGWVAGATVVGAVQGERGEFVGDGTGETVLQDASWVYGAGGGFGGEGGCWDCRGDFDGAGD